MRFISKEQIDLVGLDDFNTMEEKLQKYKEFVQEGFLQSILELSVAYEENKISSERFAEKVCGLRNVYYKNIRDRVS
jgi:hypothetical protein